MIVLLYQKSTELTLKNVLFFIKAHILFFFFFFLKALIHDLILLIKKQKLLSLYYNIIMRKIFSAFCLIIVFMGAQKLKIILNF
ncbi:hypothetical protein EPC75_06065 [Helicobacter pylori]|nr:hypothetical protein EPC73_04225 [Helicobacter pylori]KAA6505190.1 hypothetical protein EPC78_00690 [Helicobacter pylori]KAA6517155.1 hypothetical protein EPC75_06065 [Helicobacter pylori]